MQNTPISRQIPPFFLASKKLRLEGCVGVICIYIGAMCVPEGFEMAYAQNAIGTMFNA